MKVVTQHIVKLAQMGWTALMLASYRGHVEIVELLLEFGSDVNLTTEVSNSVWVYQYTTPTMQAY